MVYRTKKEKIEKLKTQITISYHQAKKKMGELAELDLREARELDKELDTI
jgi:hypothetical protein